MSRRAVVRAPAPASPASSLPLYRKCCGSQSHTQEDDDTSGALGVQSKLTIGARGDAYEREADAVAARAIQADSTPGEPPRITPLVQRKSTGGTASARTTGLESELRSRRGQGTPLPKATRSSMEDRFGVDFSRVRIHADPAAQRLTTELDSFAFTQGSDIYFSGGQYRPGTEAGDRLLAHELTHVVQQGGGSSGTSPYIQRDDKEGTGEQEPEQETKTYYMVYPSHPMLGARGPISGRGVHGGMENRLRKHNPALVTEAPIPGGTESNFFEETSDRWKHFTHLGRADLYMSSIPNGICGIRGRLSEETLQGDHTTAKYEYKGRRNSSAEVGSGKLKMVPSMHSQVPPFKGNFPTDIYVADLKPFGIFKIGEGLRQIQNYLTGYRNFAARAKQDKVTATGDPANITGHGLDVAATQGSSTTAMFVPPGLDYRNMDNPAEDRRRDREQGAFIAGSIRYWLAPMPDRGVYIYFHQAHPSPRDVTPDDIRAVIEGVDPALGMKPDGSLKGMRGRLRTPDPGMPSGIDLSTQSKPRPGARPDALEREEDDETADTPVQRKELSRPKHEWKKLGKDWEADRDVWKKHKAKPFLDRKSVAALAWRNEVDDKLGIHRSKPPADRATLLKQVEQISLWSSVTGGVIGRIRFALGDKFDDVAAFFERIRNRFKTAHQKVSTAEAPRVLGGWKKRLFYQIAMAAKTMLGNFLAGLFDKLGNCISGIIMEMISEFTDDISEKLREKLEGIEKYVAEQKKLLEKEFEEHFGRVEDAIETLREGQKIVGIIADAVTGIRLAVQLVACVSPPGLGCLWGLLAQLGISAALDLIVGTDGFNKKVLNPALAEIFGDSLNNAQKKIVAALIPASLEPYAKSPSCGITQPQEPFVPQVTGGITGEAELRKLRDGWEAKNKDQLIREIQDGTHNGEGATPTREEVLEIAEAMKRSGLTPAEFQKAAEKTPRDGSGRPILDAFQMQMDKAIVEKSAPSGPGAPADPSQPRPSGPSLSIRKRLNLPARPHVGPTPEGPQLIVPLDKKRQIEIGPKILPPVGPEEEPAIGGGATIRF